MKWQRLVQALFLIGFIGVMATGYVQLWMLVFAGSLVGALLLSRFYCGWLCPINTLTDVVNGLYRKMKWKRKPVPGWAKSPWVRVVVLAAFLGILFMTIRTGRRLPVLPALTVLGVVLTLAFVPAFWHRYLCPYGTLLSLPGKFARLHWFVKKDDCTGCNVCVRVCPAEAVAVDSTTHKARIDKSLCLACTACAKACPTETILFGKEA